MVYSCPECDFAVKKKSRLLQHHREANHWRSFRCDVCGALFTRRANLDRHTEKHNSAQNVHCADCGRSFSRHDALQRHMQQKHQVGGGQRNVPVVNVNEEGNPVTRKLKKADDPRDFYTVSKITHKSIKKFRTTASTYRVTFKNIEVDEDIFATPKRLFTAIFKDITCTRDSTSKDLVRLTVQSPSLDYPVVIPFMKVDELTSDRFMSELERVLQSNEDFMIHSGLIFEVTLVHVDMPNGSGRKHCKYVDRSNF